jgi:hypothetical protein
MSLFLPSPSSLSPPPYLYRSCVVFFVPSGRESEFQFSTQAGLQGIAAEAQCRYRTHTYTYIHRNMVLVVVRVVMLALILMVYDDDYDHGDCVCDCARHDMICSCSVLYLSLEQSRTVGRER